MNVLNQRLVSCLQFLAPVVLLATTLILAASRLQAKDGKAAGQSAATTSRQLATLANQDILESSGLAVSQQTPDLFWTHNDSGDTARLFAFDTIGRDQAVVSLQGIKADDWEDMASFRRDEQAWLLVADVGDNARRRDLYQLHLLPEPRLTETEVQVHTTINFRLAGGSQNCEGVGIDATSNTVLLATKSTLRTNIFELKLPAAPNSQPLTAKLISTVSVPFATGFDISPNGQHAIIITYANAFEFNRMKDESWGDAFKRAPNTLDMPPRKQGESICYSSDSRSLFLTSERTPTPLWQVTLDR